MQIIIFPALLICFEFLMSKYYDKKQSGVLKFYLQVLVKAVILVFLFFLVINIPRSEEATILFPKYSGLIQGAEYALSTLSAYLKPFFWVHYKLSLSMICLYILFYSFFVVRKKILRFTITVLLPLSIAVLVVFGYYAAGENEFSLKKIYAQKEVEVVFPLTQIKDWARENDLIKQGWGWKLFGFWPRPRDLVVSGNSAYVSYASDIQQITNPPSFLRVDLLTREIKAIPVSGVRAFRIDNQNSRIFIGIWLPAKIQVVDKDSLKQLFAIEFNRLFKNEEELITFYFDGNDILIFFFNRSKKIVKYSISNDNILGIIDLKSESSGNVGDIWKAQYIPATGKLYFLLFPAKDSLFELDPQRFMITKKVRLPSQGASFAYDGFHNSLLISAVSDTRLWELSLPDLGIINTYAAPIGARQVYALNNQKVVFFSYNDGYCYILSRASRKLERSYYIGQSPEAICADNGYFYISSYAGIVRIRQDDF